jgi:hypothetical protein
MGQKAKYSLRAHRVRFAPESGLKSDIAGGPVRVTSGLRLFDKFAQLLDAHVAEDIEGLPHSFELLQASGKVRCLHVSTPKAMCQSLFVGTWINE